MKVKNLKDLTYKIHGIGQELTTIFGGIYRLCSLPKTMIRNIEKEC